MERYFSGFRIKIINEQFCYNEITTEKSVLISLYDIQNQLIDELKRGLVEASTIYQKIEKNEKIDLSNCYIENFSFSIYRKKKHIEQSSPVELKELICENAFFNYEPDSFEPIDFSNLVINTEQSNFKNSIFTGAKSLIFDNSIFKGNVFFDYSLFNSMDVSFSNIQFSGSVVSFKNAIFKEGLKRFEKIKFNCHEVIFLNTEFGNGDAIFSDSDFGNALVNFKVARFGKGRIDFNKVILGSGGLSFEKAEFGDGNVNFRAANFGSGNIEFTRCVFGEGDISFIATIFDKCDVSFAGTEFGSGKLTFKQTYFGGGKLDFHYAHFGNGDISFERTNFLQGNVDFRAVDFGVGKITFNRVYFGTGEVVFEASEMKSGTIAFRKTSFGPGIFNFEMADFKNAELIIDDVDFGGGKVSFRQSKFNLLSLVSSQMNNYFDLRVEECGKLDLSNAIVKDIIDIDSSEFKTNIKALDLSGIRLLGRIFLDWRQNNVKELIHHQKTSNANKAAQFRVLKQNYNQTGQYEYEDAAYVEFKRCEAKSIYEENTVGKSFIQKIKAKLTYLFQYILFDKVGHYATNPLRVLVSMAVVYLSFCLLYIFILFVSDTSSINSSLFQLGDPRDLNVVQKSFYHSIVTFLTIGYGDYYPSGVIRWLSGIEGFTGLFLMSYFTVAFVRKILR